MISKIEPRDNSYSNGNGFKIKYSEENLKEIILHYADKQITLTGCERGINKECSKNIDLSAYNGETIQYWFTVNDEVNTIDSKKNNIKIDTVTPTLTINSPFNEENYIKKIELDVSVNEKVKSLDYNDNDKGYRRLCSNCNTYKKSKSLVAGEHDFKIRATDYAGNEDIEERSFTITSS